MIIYANQCLRASITAMHEVLEVIAREKSTVSIEGKITAVKEIFELQGMMKLKEDEKKYVRTQKTVHAIIPAAGKPATEDSLETFLQDCPMAMLDVEGKPLLQRIVESLNLAGIQDVTVITGYLGEKVDVDAIERRHVADHHLVGLLHSIEQAADKFSDSVLIHFGDVIVSHENLRALVACDDPIVLMVSPLLRGDRYERKAFDLVEMEKPRSAGRTLEKNPKSTLKSIGKALDAARSHGEFIGLLLLNPEGVRIWREAIKKLPEAKIRTWSLNDFLQALIDDGAPITTFESQTGWAEVHSHGDYEQLCGLLRSEQ